MVHSRMNWVSNASSAARRAADYSNDSNQSKGKLLASFMLLHAPPPIWPANSGSRREGGAAICGWQLTWVRARVRVVCVSLLFCHFQINNLWSRSSAGWCSSRACRYNYTLRENFNFSNSWEALSLAALRPWPRPSIPRSLFIFKPPSGTFHETCRILFIPNTCMMCGHYVYC